MRNLYNKKEKFYDAFVSYLINPYFYCENPVCMLICPANAFNKRESNGIVIVDSTKCLGN